MQLPSRLFCHHSCLIILPGTLSQKRSRTIGLWPPEVRGNRHGIYEILTKNLFRVSHGRIWGS